MMQGIDVSKWQGRIDWKKVKKAGKEFAILKVTEKNNRVEAAFEQNYAGCRKNGIPVGVYHYVYARTLSEAKREAEAVIKALKGKKIECGVWLDMEYAGLKNIGGNYLTAIINAEAKPLMAAGHKVGIYCNRNWYYHVLHGEILAKKYPFWIARYPARDTGGMKESLSPKKYAVMWQYSSKGRVSGIRRQVDLDVSFVDVVHLMSSGNEKALSKVQEAAKNSTGKERVSGINPSGRDEAAAVHSSGGDKDAAGAKAPGKGAVISSHDEASGADRDAAYYPEYVGSSASIADALRSMKIDYSYAFRKKIAAANGINSYTGTAAQNIKLLELLRQGKLRRA